MGPQPRLPVRERRRRDARIAQAFREGLRVCELQRRFGLSGTQIQAILRQWVRRTA